MGRDDPTVEFGSHVGQLHTVIDAGDQGGIVDVLGVHTLAVRPHDRDGVGEVELVLGVVGRQPAQR